MFVKYILFFLVSCSVIDKNYQLKNQELAQTAKLNIEYELNSLPKWADTSSSAKCFRDINFNYLNYEKLNKSFALNYLQSSQLQALYSQSKNEEMKTKSGLGLSSFDEERIFFDSLKKIQNNLYVFDMKKYSSVVVVWIDGLDVKQLVSLKKVFKKYENQYFPVFLSFCLSTPQVEELVYSRFPGQTFKVLSREYVSPYSKELGPQYEMGLWLSELIGNNKKIIFMKSESAKFPTEIFDSKNFEQQLVNF